MSTILARNPKCRRPALTNTPGLVHHVHLQALSRPPRRADTGLEIRRAV